MTKSKRGIDKNLQNEVAALEIDPVNSQQAQQINQKRADRKHEEAKKHHKSKDMNPTH